MVERLHVIKGSMFAGKTEELLRLASRESYAGNSFLIFKPSVDDRWGKVDIVRSHSGKEQRALVVPTNSPELILESVLENGKPIFDAVFIDEVQFFNEGVISVVKKLTDADVRVYVSGLSLDFRGEPFGSMPTLLAMADDITNLTAICTYSDNGEICGENATRTQRIVNGVPANYGDPIVLIGAEESYTARCINHHIVPGKPE